jgi:hypothetical protein
LLSEVVHCISLRTIARVEVGLDRRPELS